ncbi:MAG TPA: arginine--tRNA ligase [Thermoanaerobaculia bacterium]|nr:arginine--tRNA ligase [Thermoanaerobaculia bacterium]
MILEEIAERLSEQLRSRVLTLFGHAVDRIVLQTPPRLAMGDLATPVALELAKSLKKPPRQIAASLLEGLTLPPLVATASVEGAGYLNFRFDRRAFTAALYRNVMASPAASGDRILVEHTNINPNKAAHIGHLRNAVLGDTLVQCLKWLGGRVETQNYIDDTGVQVADVAVAFERLLGESPADVLARSEDPETRFDFFCWDLYARIGREYERSPEAKEWRKEALHRIENREGTTAEIASIVAAAIVRRHLETMLRLGIRYDVLTKESDILHLHFWDRAFELLKDSGAVIYETEGKHRGCWVMKLTESAEFEGLEEPDKILVRSNGTVTYVGKDIAYQLWKFGLLDRTFGYRVFSRYPDAQTVWETTSRDDADSGAPRFGGAGTVYNVIDTRQAYLQKVVREGLRLLGHEREAERSIHFSYEMVALSPSTASALGMAISEEDAQKIYLEMSGRKGLGVKADDLLDALEAKAFEAVREGATRGDAAGEEGSIASIEAESRDLARRIAVGALRYFMLKYGRNKVIAFDFDEALSFEGDSGPYLQYSTVRVQNIFRKMRERGVDPMIDEASVDRLTLGDDLGDEMWQIVRQSAETAAVIRRAVEALELSMLTRHALELAQNFNSFYHKFSILNEKDPAERQRRAVCAEIFRRTMVGLMELLGIPVPARM